jgi:acetamidase/formamidase
MAMRFVYQWRLLKEAPRHVVPGGSSHPPTAWGTHPRRAVHGCLQCGPLTCTAPRLDQARAEPARPRRPRLSTRYRRGAVPSHGPAATEGLRTLPPRENGGNFDVKQLTKGAKLLLPVAVEGALFSVGDGHFAQGDGEVCVTAVEMGATVAVRFRVLKDAATSHPMRGPRFSHAGYFAPPEWAVPQRFVATMGMPIRDNGVNEGET